MKLSSVNLLDLMNTVPVGIFSVDMDLNINFINATGLDILKISEEDVLGKNCQAIMRNDLCKEACPLQQTLDTGEAIINKTVCITPHNKRFPVSISTAAMRDKKGNIVKYGVLKRKPDMEKLRNDFISFSITDEEVDETIKNFYEKYKVIIEPHTAVGIKSYEKSKIDDLTVVLQTADPAKFPEKIKKILNIEPEIPDTLKEIIEKEENFDVIENDYETFKNYILSRVK